MKAVVVEQKKSGWRINTNTAISCICLFLLSIPRNENAFPLICMILKSVQVPCCLYGIYVFLMSRTYKNKWLHPMWWMCVCVCVCTIVQQPQYTISVCLYSLRIFSVVVITDYLLKRSINVGIRCIAVVWNVFMCLQGVSLVTHCFGVAQSSNISVTNNYFFGTRNEINQYIIYTMAFAWYSVYVTKSNRLIATTITAIGIYFVVIESVATALVGVVVFVLVQQIPKVLKNEKIWRILFVVAGICIALFIVGQNTGFFAWLIQDILKKDITLTGRTVLWNQAIEQMEGNHWLFGYGYDPEFNFEYAMMKFNHPHNQYLQMLYNFGIGGLVIYVIMIYKMIKQIKFLRNDYVKNIHIATLAATLVMCIVSRNFFYLAAPMYYVLCAYLLKC